jgi:hypothetical protein
VDVLGVWNLHKNIWSVRHKGKVISHQGTVCLSDVTFRVQPAGRDRVRSEGKKNVHAFACGKYEPARSYHDNKLGRNITYNPYKYDTFVYSDDLTPVGHCDRVYLAGKTMWEVL